MFWIVLTLCLGVAALFAAAPFLRPEPSQPEGDGRRHLYQRQIAEIEEEEKQGVISSSEAAGLRVEAQRRMLAAATNEIELKEASVPLSRTTTALIIAGMVVAGGAGLYAVKGSPTTPSASRMPLAASLDRQPTPVQASPTLATASVGSVDTMVDRLAARLEQSPDDVEGWRMLGWSYFNVDKYQEAARAYARAVTLSPKNASYRSAQGEALVMAAGGYVTDEALSVFEQTLTLDPDDPRARFFKGLSLDQAGDPAAAISAWIDMVASAAPGADWVPDLRQRIFTRAAEAGVDIAGRLEAADDSTRPPQTIGPTVAQIQAAMEKPADDRQDMIEGMVASLAARLAEDPNDPEGWVRLIRSKTVLGRHGEAEQDLRSAIAAFADAPETKARVIAEAEALGVRLQ